ncbi:hypothetical protein SS50377_20426 [Spironucleus salmonicida]|uniref:Uncharacterized protein n=1 Tax=Spironucleus salmonicida TaxID=348837 RepID=V6LXN8_9EUKA|nr:hypothetical protein SS50377_20426 [Spironucleus salmonicida]|eukprot:EST45584.1 Hypothetical protein SS50377_14430 [Spironucleus salmonicida]
MKPIQQKKIRKNLSALQQPKSLLQGQKLNFNLLTLSPMKFVDSNSIEDANQVTDRFQTVPFRLFIKPETNSGQSQIATDLFCNDFKLPEEDADEGNLTDRFIVSQKPITSNTQYCSMFTVDEEEEYLM